MAVRVDTSSKKLTVSNTDPKYTTKEFSTDPDQAVDTASLHWTNYVMCGYKGVFDFLRESNKTLPSEVGLQIMVDGRVPTGSGLSSSSALTCATAVAVMAAHNLSFTKVEVADFACKCERHCGTQSGGMDQVSDTSLQQRLKKTSFSRRTHFRGAPFFSFRAIVKSVVYIPTPQPAQAISIMGQIGVAKLVDFNPVRAADVKLPEVSSERNALFIQERLCRTCSSFSFVVKRFSSILNKKTLVSFFLPVHAGLCVLDWKLPRREQQSRDCSRALQFTCRRVSTCIHPSRHEAWGISS